MCMILLKFYIRALDNSGESWGIAYRREGKLLLSVGQVEEDKVSTGENYGNWTK